MKRALVGFLACPVCLGDLEIKSAYPDNRSDDHEIIDGILACRSCARWYPVRGRIPEVYPDHLRDWARDLEFLKRLEPAIGLEIAESLRSKTAVSSAGISPLIELTPDRENLVPAARYEAEADVSHGAESTFGNAADLADVPIPYMFSEGESILQKKDRAASERAADRAIESSFDLPISAVPDPGAPFKLSEMDIASRVDDPDFFSPGRTAPFNPADPEYTTRAIRRFGVALTLLDLKPGAVVLDAGTGYAWTSEWLARSGFVPIGLDICRTYLEIGLRRMGDSSPHLIAADVENLPLKSGCLDAVLAFDAFHHVPDRPAALAHFFRALKTPGRIVLAEPGPGHGTEPASVEVMKKYGILEKGLSFRDVKSYIRHLPGATLLQHHVFRFTRGSFPATLKTGRDLVHAALYAVIHSASALLPARLRRALQSPKTVARLKTTFRYSDYRFFVVDKRGLRA